MKLRWVVEVTVAVAVVAGSEQVALAGSEPIFDDGFEDASLCAWSSATNSGGCCGGVVYSETFTTDGPGWPAAWGEAGVSVATADVVAGRARLRPIASGYSLARMVAAVPTREVEVRFTLEFEDVDTQGVGFYVRQNGGYLEQTDPTGQGYAVFVEGFRGPGIGVWKEVDGVEIPLAITFDNGLGFVNGVPYRVRFRLHQVDATSTRLRGKVWPVGDPEPAAWQVDFLDASAPQLQGITGGLGIDSWSELTSPNPIVAHTSVDDIEVEQLCNPLEALGAPVQVVTGYQFTEGPLWRGDHLLFTDIDGDTIARLDPPMAESVHRSPSGRANGLALDLDGALLSAEHGGRRLAREDPDTLVVTPLVETWNGQRFNSPNDLVVRSDGTVYFTDPDYGLLVPGDREINFNGVYRLPPAGTAVAEWEGGIGQNQPNGIALSPDETRLWVTDTHAGELLAFDVAVDGSLSNRRTVATGLSIPDGICIDTRGNVIVATWAPSLVFFDAEGELWGSRPVPENATNCAFGGAGFATLWVTAGDSVYRAEAVFPGLR